MRMYNLWTRHSAWERKSIFPARLSKEPKSTHAHGWCSAKAKRTSCHRVLRGSMKRRTFAWMSRAGIIGNGSGWCSQHASSWNFCTTRRVIWDEIEISITPMTTVVLSSLEAGVFASWDSVCLLRLRFLVETSDCHSSPGFNCRKAISSAFLSAAACSWVFSRTLKRNMGASLKFIWCLGITQQNPDSFQMSVGRNLMQHRAICAPLSGKGPVQAGTRRKSLPTPHKHFNACVWGSSLRPSEDRSP